MIRPCAFDYNPETATSNTFQTKLLNTDSTTTQALALKEFDAMVNLLEQNQIKVEVFEDTPEPHTPDSIFPNNWFSTHQDGQIFIYSMCNHNRRLEKREDILEFLTNSLNFQFLPENDFSKYQEQEIFLEGTGSLVLDRVNKIAYCCLSVRSNKLLLQEFCQKAGYKAVVFQAFDKDKNPIYHTNVMMGIGTKWVYICLESILDKQERENVKNSLLQTGHEIIEISQEQVKNFAGNVLELENNLKEKFILISKTAFDSLKKEQKEQTEKFVKWLIPDIKTIETNGGGSVRCMVAEIFG
jgi:hypothetical protein